MASSKKYWSNILDLGPLSPEIQKMRQNEFAEHIPVEEFLGDEKALESSKTTRRDFLKFVGFTTAAATLAACEGPVIHTMPYAKQPDTVIPGVASYYASTIADGDSLGSVLVKVREGRPIKIDKNPDSKYYNETSPRINASVLSLYDSNRFKSPRIISGAGEGKKIKNVSWSNFFTSVKEGINKSASGKEVALVTRSVSSPTRKKVIASFLSSYPNAVHYQIDANPEFGAVEAYQEAYGEAGLPSYDLSVAKTIVSIGADFLGDWFGGGFNGDYAKSRKPGATMSRHIQVESNLSLSGANADERIPLKPSEKSKFIASLYSALSGDGAVTTHQKEVAAIAKEIQANPSGAVVLVGSSDKNAQQVGYKINELIQSQAFKPGLTNYYRTSTSEQQKQLLSKLKGGSIGAVVAYDVNPVYNVSNGQELAKALQQAYYVAIDLAPNESNEYAKAIAPVHHWLESWGDVELKKGYYGVQQPTISPLFNSRHFEEILLGLSSNQAAAAPAATNDSVKVAALVSPDASGEDYQSYLKNNWNASILNGATWNKAVQDGFFDSGATPSASGSVGDVAAALAALNSVKGSDYELELYTKAGLGDGTQYTNPWLQELPDPITRASWDNYLTVSKADADKLGLENKFVSNGALNGSLVNVEVNGVTLKNVPVLIQPGQAPGSLGLAIGYGRTVASKIAEAIDQDTIGVNAYKVMNDGNKFQPNVKITKVDDEHEFALTQLQATLMGRDKILREANNEAYKKIINSTGEERLHLLEEFNEQEQLGTYAGEKPIGKIDLWNGFDRSVGIHFNLSIDLAACTGCGACVIACHSENNVPVVGKSEVRKFRDMHWMRIDRYYSSNETFDGDAEKVSKLNGVFGGGGIKQGFENLEHPSANPEVAFQPVMCQHCNHAPCETVCPVAATSHGKEGQNFMAYNRCVGTRYCANNCPYKVRRFNWFLYNQNDEFDFNMNDDLARMVLNPDVNVRSRGVMEKCSMCVQMTQAAKLKAKQEGRPVRDEEFQTACSNACPTGALVFGDINDDSSQVAALHDLEKNPRKYYLLEQVGTKPNVFYNVKIRNKA